MPTLVRPFASFHSAAFNLSEQRDIFIQDSNFGNDVAEWLADRLSDEGFEVSDQIHQDETGWFVPFEKDADKFDLGVTALSVDNQTWLVWIEPTPGFFGKMLGRHRTPVPEAVLRKLHQILAKSPAVEALRWHTREQFKRGDFDEGEISPVAP